MIRPITDEPVHHLVQQEEADRIDRPRNSAAACRRSKCDPDHLLPVVCLKTVKRGLSLSERKSRRGCV